MRKILSLLTALTLFLSSFTYLYAEGKRIENASSIGNQSQYYDTLIQSGPYTGIQRAFMIYNQYATGVIRLSNGTYKECYFRNIIYYTLDSANISYDKDIADYVYRVPKVSEDFAMIKCPGKKFPQCISFTSYQIGDTVAVETNTNVSGLCSITIYSYQEDQWAIAATANSFSDISDEKEVSIIEYTITSDDKRLLADSHFVISLEDGTIEEYDLYFFIVVGELNGVITLKKIIAIACSFVLLALVVVIVRAFIRKSNKD